MTKTRKLLRRTAYAFGVLMCVLVTTIGVLLLQEGWTHRQPILLFLGLVVTVLFGTTALYQVVHPFEHYPLGRLIAKWLGVGGVTALFVLLTSQIIIPVILTAMFVNMVPLAIWKLASLSWGLPGTPEKAYWYVSLVAYSILLTYKAGPLTLPFIPRRIKRSYPGLLRLLEPRCIRAAIYIAMAGAYAIANVETFSGTIMLSVPLWSLNKDVLLEVLVTYTIIDAAISTLSTLDIKSWMSGGGKPNTGA